MIDDSIGAASFSQIHQSTFTCLHSVRNSEAHRFSRKLGSNETRFVALEVNFAFGLWSLLHLKSKTFIKESHKYLRAGVVFMTRE